MNSIINKIKKIFGKEKKSKYNSIDMYLLNECVGSIVDKRATKSLNTLIHDNSDDYVFDDIVKGLNKKNENKTKNG